MLRRFLFNLKNGTESLNYGREIIAAWGASHVNAHSHPTQLLDVGLGNGHDLLNIQAQANIPAHLFGIESYAPYIQAAREKGITIASLDIERERFPFEDQSFDVVVANQILEHTKEIFFIIAEVGRVLKPNGKLIIGVPNLASLHNRIALLLGQQPTTIDVLGPHVRAFTRRSFTHFLETNDYFKVVDFKGSNFYPFPPTLSTRLSRLFPMAAVGSFYLVERTEKRGYFTEILHQQFFETPFFTGEEDAREKIRR